MHDYQCDKIKQNYGFKWIKLDRWIFSLFCVIFVSLTSVIRIFKKKLDFIITTAKKNCSIFLMSRELSKERLTVFCSFFMFRAKLTAHQIIFTSLFIGSIDFFLQCINVQLIAFKTQWCCKEPLSKIIANLSNEVKNASIHLRKCLNNFPNLTYT